MKVKFIKDVVLNIIASVTTTGTLQLLVYPILGRTLDEVTFGVFLLCIGLVNAIAMVIGGSLSNVRLLLQKNNRFKYRKVPDYSLLFIRFLLIGACLFLIVLSFIENLWVKDSILLLILLVLTSFRSYTVVFYRLRLNFRLVLSHSLITAIGYLIGLSILTLFDLDSWEIVFIVGELISTIFLFYTTRIRYDVLKKSPRYNIIKQTYVQLTFANTIGSALLYFDRFLLFPVLGGIGVSIYYAASIIGKMLGIVTQPLANVLLSYLSKSGNTLSRKSTLYIISVTLIATIIGYLVCNILSPTLIHVLYPNVHAEAIAVSSIANLGAVLLAVGNLLHPVVLKFCEVKLQSIIQGVYGFIYVTLGFILANQFGVIGFAWAAVLAGASRIVLMLISLLVRSKEMEYA